MALGAVAVVTVGFVGAYASGTGAQPAVDPVVLDVVSIDAVGQRIDVPDGVPALSATGAVVAYDTIDPTIAVDVGNQLDAAGTPISNRRVFVSDRVGGTSRPVGDPRSAAPGISGNGCVVAYSVFGPTEAGADVTLTVVDRCVASIDDPLPIGAPLDTVSLGAADIAAASSAAPALSFDGSTIVWSTGSEIRQYVRATPAAPYVPGNSVDGPTPTSPEVVTGTQVDVSADGRTVVFEAGLGGAPFVPAPSNVYVWSAADPNAVPELISATSPEAQGSYSSSSPTISSDGLFVVFESIRTDLPVSNGSTVAKPFVVGAELADRSTKMLVDDATRPTVSADGNHVVYQRGTAIRVLSSGATQSTDVGSAELAVAGPTSGVAISQFGRWLVFAGAGDLGGARAVWAVDRASSITDVIDTTTSTTTPPPTTPTTSPTTRPTAPSSTAPDVASQPPPTTLVAAPVVTRFPTATTQFPSVGFPSSSSGRPVVTGSGSSFIPGAGVGVAAFASPATFGPTVVDAGRRTQPVTLTNATVRTLQVSSSFIDIPDVFSITSDGCTGTSLAPGASCAIDVQFAPITVGRAIAGVTFRMSDGTVVTAALDGDGVPEPTLDVVPAVAGAGQTVTVFGAGFPANTTVEFSQPGTSIAEPIVVDANGTFAHVVVVLPNTPTGPAVLGVWGQPDAFADVVAELLVSSRSATSADAALRGSLGGSPGR